MLQVALPLSFVADSPPGLSWEIAEHVADVDRAAWTRVCGLDDWGMRLDALAVQQAALAGQARCRFAVIRDGDGAPVAAAALALFHADIVRGGGRLARLADMVRRVYPGFLKTRVLFCGLPVPCGGSHLRLARGADADAVLHLIDRHLRELAQREGARLVVVKELSAADEPIARALQCRGYLRGAVPPNYHLKRTFDDIEAYRIAIRTDYRRALDAAWKNFDALGLSISHITDPHEIARRFDDRLHRLYLQVWEHSAQRMECFPKSFFQRLPAALPGQVVLSIIEHAGEPVAFGFAVLQAGRYHALYLGYEEQLNKAGSLYFNVIYRSMNWAFRNGAKELVLGQSGDETKAKLGAEPDPLCFMVKASGPLLQRLLQRFSSQIFPTVRALPAHHVFANPQGRLPGMIAKRDKESFKDDLARDGA